MLEAGFSGVLRPSSASEWGVGGCPAAPRMQALFPEVEGIEAREGTAAHHAATEGVEGRTVKLGDAAPNGVATDKGMISGAGLYINAVLSRQRLASSTAMTRVETKVFAHASVHPQNEGTPDTFILDAAQKRLDVFDYKYGFSFVSEYRNPQLMDYGVAILETSGFSREETGDWIIHFHVVQPRYYTRDPVRSWACPAPELWAYADQLKAAAIEATAPNAPARPGPHCHHCSARIHCDASRRMTGHFLSLASSGAPAGMDTAAMGTHLLHVTEGVKRLESIKKALDAELLVRVEAGERGSGYKRGNAGTQERWKDPDQVLLMGDLLGVDLRAPEEPISPYQAKLLKRVDEAVIAAYAHKPTGKAKLVPDSENPADRVFGAPPQRN